MTYPREPFVTPARPRAALWRLLVGLGLIGAVYLGGAGLLLGGLSWGVADPEALLRGEDPLGVLLLLASFAPLVFGIWLCVRLVHGRGFATLLGRDWFLPFLRGALLVGLLVAAELFLAHRAGFRSLPGLPVQLWLLLLPVALVATAVQTLAEELLFRGYLLQQLAARFASPLMWLVFPALLFGFAHAQPAEFGTAWFYPVIGATLFGLISADLTARSGSLGLAWGMHFANNTVALCLLATGPIMTGLALRISPHDMKDLAETPWIFALDLVPMLIAWAILRR